MTGQLAELLSLRRIADVPFGAYLAAPDSWQLTGHHGELRPGHSLPRGPIQSADTAAKVHRQAQGLVADHLRQVPEGS